MTRRCWRPAAQSSWCAPCLPAMRATVSRSGAPTWASRNPRPRHGLLPVQQRCGRRHGRADGTPGCHACRSSTGMCTTATARRTFSTTPPRCSSLHTPVPVLPWLRRFPIGAGAGEGYTINVPLPASVGGGACSCTSKLTAAAELFLPDLILVSAGYDAHWDNHWRGCACRWVAIGGWRRPMVSAG